MLVVFLITDECMISVDKGMKIMNGVTMPVISLQISNEARLEKYKVLLEVLLFKQIDSKKGLRI